MYLLRKKMYKCFMHTLKKSINKFSKRNKTVKILTQFKNELKMLKNTL